MKKKYLILFLSLVFIFSGCVMKDNKSEVPMEKYNETFYDAFDTVITLTIFAPSEKEAKEFFDITKERFIELHKEFTTYENYDGLNNAKTINDKAGIEPVKVSDDLFNLIKFSKECYEKYSKDTDISMGSVLKVWHNYRDPYLLENIKDEDESKYIPSLSELEEAKKHIGIEHIILDENEKTVFIDDKDVSLDIGATAKGYAVELISDELVEKGYDSFLISAGGNVKVVGSPKDGRDNWTVGIQNPDAILGNDSENLSETINIKDLSVVTSGNYQRFYKVNDKVYHHLIDKDTLFPGEYFKSTTVIYEDSGLADFLSTTMFLMPYEEGRKLIESIDGADAIWLDNENNEYYTEGVKSLLKK